MLGDGSSTAPWNRLDSVIAWGKFGTTIKSHDTLLLFSGYHGRILANGSAACSSITIMANAGEVPRLAAIELRTCTGWILKGLMLSPTFALTFSAITMINFAASSPGCSAEDCYAFCIENSSGWDSLSWNNLVADGISLNGKSQAARRCHFKNVDFGINVTGDSCLVESCRVENFAGDGMRGLGDYGVFQYNYISGCYAVNANHDDGFQSWSVGAGGVGTDTVRGIVLRGNTFICYFDSLQPFRGNLQGIGCFDGFFKDWIIENNVICTDMWHGISLYGAINCRIINNTVCDENTLPPGPPWVGIFNHKNGTPSSGCVIRNNLSTAFTYGGSVNDHNKVLTNSAAGYASWFVDYAYFDFHLKSSALAVDSGSSVFAPAFDHDGNVRPFGSAVDIGAYEYSGAGAVAQPALLRQSATPATIRLDAGTITLTLAAPLRSGVLSIYDALGKSISAVDLKTTAHVQNSKSKYVYTCKSYAPYTAGIYSAVVEGFSLDARAICDRLKLVVVR